MSSRKKVRNYSIFLDKPLGEGVFSKVYLCHSIANPEISFAAKVIDKKLLQGNQYMQEAIRRQFQIHKQLSHQNIVGLVDMHETLNNIYIFQEYCAGTTLKEVMKKAGNLSEGDTLNCVKQICKGYSQLVRKGIIHRDLKPENIMISEGVLKIGDFGFAKQIASRNQMLTSIVGSPIYMAPQILKGEKYNSKCDVWSFGIIIFQMLYGHFPWVNKNGPPLTSMAVLKKVLQEPLKFPDSPKVSQKMKDFIEQCLISDENQRMSWLQIFQHPLISGEQQFLVIASEYRNNTEIAVKLLNQLAEKVKPFQLVGSFLQFQVKALDFKNFRTIMKQYLIPHATEEQVNLMYQMFDKDCNGVVDIEQFVKSFKICDEQVLKLLNMLVEKGMKYQNLKKHEEFMKQSSQIGEFSEQIIEKAYEIIKQVEYE